MKANIMIIILRYIIFDDRRMFPDVGLWFWRIGSVMDASPDLHQWSELELVRLRTFGTEALAAPQHHGGSPISHHMCKRVAL